jgi:hypothetical protein
VADEPEDKSPPRAEEPEDLPTSSAGQPEVKAAEKRPPEAAPSAPAEEPTQAAESDGWRFSVDGYFRAPVTLGLSSRPTPDNLNGPAKTQVSYGPNRTVDSSYYSFAYTRLQEQDWAEVFFHEKTKHVDVAVGWMGYWFAGTGYRNPDAAWAPAVAYVALNTDIGSAALKPNIALTMGAWWPKFGYFEKYDTYTLGRFRQMGEQVHLQVPLTTDLTVDLVQGFGTNRDGSWNSTLPPLYATTTGVDLLTYANAQVSYKKYVDAGVHFNTMWTADPNLTQQTTPGKAFTDASSAHLTVVGGEANLRAPYAGHLWVSPSFISARDGWALANGGTEVMHSLGGAGIATNYLGWNNTPSSATGTGTMLNLGFMYENSLSSIQDHEPGSTPEVTASVFGLLSRSKLDLPAGSTFPQNTLNEFKAGADVTVQALNWLGVMLRYDSVNLDTDHPGYVFSAVSSRVIFSSHFLSRERVYIQYSRYRYGDYMVLNGIWPWGSPLVAGSDILQAGAYAKTRPDYNVVKLQAEATF